MTQTVSMEDALRCAVLTAKEQPREVPNAWAGWIEEAEDALDSHDASRIGDAVKSVLMAHTQYRADFDVKGWLYDLRNAARAVR
ncbi:MULTISPECIES: hypothetical protein [Pandoraea]|uniref:hypothetical protein n=1 Tax=Pandoraea TaxID=93217 RepID=UPI001242B9CB|nr:MULTISPECIES: hypothetical protein [Pandoraea]